MGVGVVGVSGQPLHFENEEKLLFERPFDKKRLTALDQRVGHTLFHKPTEDEKQRNRKKTAGTGDV